jgi:hypothetical protein
VASESTEDPSEMDNRLLRWLKRPSHRTLLQVIIYTDPWGRVSKSSEREMSKLTKLVTTRTAQSNEQRIPVNTENGVSTNMNTNHEIIIA